jgi:hypothetical protein
MCRESQASGDTRDEVGHAARSAYTPGPDGLTLLDPPDGNFAGTPPFEELSSGLVATAPDVLRFFCTMADGGAPILTADSVGLMTTPAPTDAQRQQAFPIIEQGGSGGLGTAPAVEPSAPWMAPGRWGWNGGTGTSAYAIRLGRQSRSS